jgi:C-terminal processing protease CtpA/Prc
MARRLEIVPTSWPSSSGGSLSIRIASLIFLTLLTGLPAYADGVNMDFEAGPAGQLPTGWTVMGSAGSFIADPDQPQAGHLSGLLSVAAPPAGGAAPNPGCDVEQHIDATPYRGQFAVLRAAIRTATEANADDYLWIRADGPDNHRLALANTEDRSLASEDWRFQTLLIRVPESAQTLHFGLALHGGGRVWIDTVSIIAMSPTALGVIPPRPLSARGLVNLMALQRLLGVVRFFYPGDQAAGLDWNAFAFSAVARVEAAPDAAALARVLSEQFAPVAPAVRVAARAAPTPWQASSCSACTVIGWRHAGLQMPLWTGPYQSARVETPAKDPVTLDLGGGVFAAIPITLPRDKDGTLPHAPPPTISPPTPALVAPTGYDRSTRLADIVLFAPIIAQSYPYYAALKDKWDGAVRQALQQAAIDGDDAAFQKTLELLVAVLNDDHGWVTHFDALYRLPLRLEWVEGKLAVVGVGADVGPVAVGDVLMAIDGQSSDAAAHELGTTISAATLQWRETVEEEDLMQRPDNAPVTLTLQRPDGATYVATLTPRSGNRPARVYLPPPLRMMGDGVWYVDLSRLSAAQLQGALDQLATAKAIIFDLREYPTDAALAALYHLANHPLRSDYFDIPVFSEPDQKDARYNGHGGWVLDPVEPLLPGKFVFLTGPDAVSYAESVLSVVYREKLGPIVGATSAGTNGNVNAVWLPGGYHIEWTGMRVTHEDGSPEFGVGFAPDYPVSPSLAGIHAGRDEVLEAGIRVAKSLAGIENTGVGQ